LQFRISFEALYPYPLSVFSYIKNLAGIPALILKVTRQLNTQRAFLDKELKDYINEVKTNNDGSISTDDLDKITSYYGLAVPAVLGEAFAALRDCPLSEKERRGCTWLAATTGLFDDFFENTALGDGYIESLYRLPGIYKGNNSNEKLTNHCWQLALKHCANKDLLTDMASMVHRAQSDSRLQKNNNPGEEMLRRITFDKGGYSVLFYMSFFYRAIPFADEKLFYKAGALLQLENDLFDVYKDHRDKITTLVTGGTKIAALQKNYLDLWAQTKQCLSETEFSEQGKKHFLRILCGLVSRGLVCLYMLEQREKENKGFFDPTVFTRKQLICDMEKPVNLLRTIHYYAKLY
jgi:hypothetical protein